MGPPLCGVVITALRAGALLTGLATALAVGYRRSGVAITAQKAGAILRLRFASAASTATDQARRHTNLARF